jgi:hypothetical protein
MAGTLTISTLSDGTNSTSATNCIQGSAKAWVNFNGTGTVAIRGSYNVSSVTDNGTGQYTVNFTNAMPNTNYCCQNSTSSTWNSGFTGGGDRAFPMVRLMLTTSVQVEYCFDGGGDGDPLYAGVAIFS